MDDQKRTKCVIIGAGPTGALSALYAAKRGWDVEVYELRGDLRDASTTPLNFTKSINLAVSERGINALRHYGSPDLLESILKETIPMHGRMIHGQDSKGGLTEESQLYDVHGRYQRAIDRGSLNKALLSELEKLPNVRLHFHHKLTGADFQKRKAWLEVRLSEEELKDRPREIEIDFDFMLGCDGAHSAARFHIMKFVRMNYEQSYIDTLWCEFTIPPASSDRVISTSPSAKDGFATNPNRLHIWPGSDKMFIAIPNPDKTFTCTLFAPAAAFAALDKSPNDVEPFFQQHFPGAADLVGPRSLQNQYQQNPHLPLISIKCSPHHYSSSGVILGDAAHAMVPFYGQGMNAGLEDVRVLFEHLDNHPSTAEGRAAALDSYSRERVLDAHTINDLALANYWEMHAGVRSSIYLLRKKVEEFLSDKVPVTGFATQYSRVSFSNQRYSDVATAVERQRKVLVRGMLASMLVPVMGWVAWWISRWYSVGGGRSRSVNGNTWLDFLREKMSSVLGRSSNR